MFNPETYLSHCYHEDFAQNRIDFSIISHDFIVDLNPRETAQQLYQS